MDTRTVAAWSRIRSDVERGTLSLAAATVCRTIAREERVTQRKGKSSFPSRFSLASTAFLGASLVFLIQPMASKHILPWYGGTPGVWTACLLFFQAGLLVGYAYAHLCARFLPPRGQALSHGLLVIGAMIPPVLAGPEWAPREAEYPPARILATLLATVGLPYVVLSATSPLLQAWSAKLDPRRAPWHLFATSNAGSLLALAAYPFLLEPHFALGSQARIWKALLAAYAVACGAVFWRLFRMAPRQSSPQEAAPPAPAERASPRRVGLWLGWSACAVVLFMAVTNQLTLNVAAVPFLWILPLAIYLLSFILTFSHPRFYSRRLAAFLLGPAVAAFFLALPGDVQNDSALLQLGVFSRIAILGVALFVCCVVCHGELYRLRPPVAQLTRFYLSIASGGVSGGFLVGIVAPRLFLLQQELEIGLLGCGTLFLVSARRDPREIFRPRHAAAFTWVASALLAAATLGSVQLARIQLQDSIHSKRNFFGLLRVKEIPESERNATRHRRLYHGSTLHGLQVLRPDLKSRPTLYFGPISGVGLLLDPASRGRTWRVGIVGMGAATLAAYGRAGDHFRFYEIDADVVAIAREFFSYLDDTKASWDVRLGDARLSLEREDAQNFDVLVLDAFSSDAIPVHLLTVEAMGVYARHLRQDGVLAIHISNRYLDLTPVVDNLADHSGFHALHVANDDERGGTSQSSRWALLSRERSVLEEIGMRAQTLENAALIHFFIGNPAQYRRLRVWTDSYSSLSKILG
jgi:spermidine synthase